VLCERGRIGKNGYTPFHIREGGDLSVLALRAYTLLTFRGKKKGDIIISQRGKGGKGSVTLSTLSATIVHKKGVSFSSSEFLT